MAGRISCNFYEAASQYERHTSWRDYSMNRYMPGMLGAMLVLIVPAFLICAGLAIVAYRKWGDSNGE